MVFSWRGKRANAEDATEGVTSGAEVVTPEGEVVRPEADLKKFKKLHQWDPFMEVEKLDNVDAVLQTGDLEKEMAVEESLLLEDSPYPEVRSSVCFPLCLASP